MFNYEERQVRTVLKDDEPWFVGKDVADALGYEKADNAIRSRVDEEDKPMYQISASGQNRNMVIINESGKRKNSIDTICLSKFWTNQIKIKIISIKIQ